jgi:hypothetical protein
MTLVILIVLGIPIWLIARAVSAKNRLAEVLNRLSALESEVARLKLEKGSPQPVELQSSRPSQPTTVTPAPVTPAPVTPPTPISAAPQTSVSWPPPPPAFTSPPAFKPPPLPIPKIDWEQFVGVKGFAWIGGLALFLGVVFFVKYSFDNNLVPPVLRVTIGFLAGLGLLVGGVVMSRRRFPVLSQTLCATGIVILYSVTFACRSIYHFDFFGPIPTFLLMALITTTAFLLAIRLNALVVAILGMLGGFLTPVLLSTGQDNPLGLFGYIAILDVGLIVVAFNRRWYFLTALAAFGTAIMQLSWAGEFFVSEKYFEGSKILIALAVLLSFNALYLAANWWAKDRQLPDSEESLILGLGRVRARSWLSGSALGLVGVTFMLTAWFLDFDPLAQRPWLMFSFVFLVDLGVAALVLADETIAINQSIAGLAVFALLGFWTEGSLTDETLNAALAFYFLFALVHSALPTLLERRRGVTTQTWANHIFPVLALALVLVPVFTLAEVSIIVWPFILLVDLLAIALAVWTEMLLPVLAVLLFTLAATGELIFKIPSDLSGLPVSFFLLGAFAVFFAAAGIWLVKTFQPDALKSGIKFGNDLAAPGDLAAILPASAIVLPFLLLIMATLRLPLINPSPIFGLALLLIVLSLGVTKLFSLDWMPAVALACVSALECAWHFSRFDPANIRQPLDLVLTWYLIFFAVFALFPFLFWKQFSTKVIPWATAAMAGPPQFFLIHRFVSAVYPNRAMGLLPAAFAIPGLLSLVAVLRKLPAENKARMAQLAWFGGVALFFITLIFPIQFDRQWITIGWALEGMALLWLFHRVPHPGLRLTGVGLLIAAFLRLAFNPAVFDYHTRAAIPIFNWYLYAYGIVTICMFAGTRLLAPPRNQILDVNVPPILAGCGTALAFLLMNIEIADYFSEPGSTLTFELGGNFARDMSYSIGWALFALALLIYGIRKKIPAARYPAMGLLCVTLLKLFFHDLAQIGQLYRIGALIGVAVIAMLASFAYQEFFAAGNNQKNLGNETPH